MLGNPKLVQISGFSASRCGCGQTAAPNGGVSLGTVAMLAGAVALFTYLMLFTGQRVPIKRR
jgi:hypothetical protein